MAMKIQSIEISSIPKDPLEKLGNLLNRYFKEHARLNIKISEIEMLAKKIKDIGDFPVFLLNLEGLKNAAIDLVNALEEHAKWEDDVFFPCFGQTCNLSSNPTLTTSLWMLEKEHELSHVFFETFFKMADDCMKGAEYAGLYDRAKDQLLHACRLAKEHMEMEESIVIPPLGELSGPL